MSIYAEAQPTTTSTPPPVGTHAARCVSMVDCGTQPNKFDPSKPDQRKVRITFELPDELRDDQKPYLVSQKFTLTMHEKGSLRKFLQAWRGKPFTEEEAKRFDISVLLTKPCLLGIVHEQKGEKTYANITSVSAPMKGMEVTPQITPTLEFSLHPDSYDALLFEQLPDFLKEEIRESPEYQALQAPAPDLAPKDEDNDLPF